MLTILSLCDHSGVWSAPYERAGYDVVRVDLANGKDVRLLEFNGHARIYGILAAPPCDHFAASGARWWEAKGEQAILDALAVVDACLRAVAIYRPAFWALENPVGRLRRWLGPPTFTFDPCQFGDPYTKRTLLWGNFTPPMPLFAEAARNSVTPTLGSKMHRMSPTPDRKRLRSVTPAGFAEAFFQANK